MTLAIGEMSASAVREGDEILVHDRIGYCVVSSVSRDELGHVRIVYFKHGEDSWERGGRVTKPWIVERGLRPFAPDEVVRARRGSIDQADEIRVAMDNEREERWGELAQRREDEADKLARLQAERVRQEAVERFQRERRQA